MKSRIVATIFLFCSVNAIHAEPSKAVMFLVNEPLSMWDFGLHKLTKELSDVYLFKKGMASKTKFFATAIYDADENRISIFAAPPLDASSNSLSAIKADNAGDARTTCKDMINSVRFDLGANNKSLAPVAGGSSYVCSYFKHADFKNTHEPNNLCSELESMVVIKSLVYIKTGGVVQCNGQLLGERVFYSE